MGTAFHIRNRDQKANPPPRARPTSIDPDLATYRYRSTTMSARRSRRRHRRALRASRAFAGQRRGNRLKSFTAFPDALRREIEGSVMNQKSNASTNGAKKPCSNSRIASGRMDEEGRSLCGRKTKELFVEKPARAASTRNRLYQLSVSFAENFTIRGLLLKFWSPGRTALPE
jgi:hypothetical protein